jgi:DNA-binding GntR family transcriptional regulator
MAKLDAAPAVPGGEVRTTRSQRAARPRALQGEKPAAEPAPAIRFLGPELIRDRVVDALRDAIVAGRLKSGERIRERDMVAMLGVSRSPLREAIRILESEGLIRSLAHRGARVSELSATDLRELVDVRIMLEAFAARLAMDRLDQATLASLEDQVKRARAAGTRVDAWTNFSLALEFHGLLVAACGNRKVVQLHEHLRRHHRRYQHFAFSRLVGTAGQSTSTRRSWPHCAGATQGRWRRRSGNT